MALVPLEAMACARSLVATDVNGVIDSVPAEAGAIVGLDDGAGLVEAVVTRLRDPALAEAEGWAGRSHVETHHDLTNSSQELARVYLRLVGARRAR
jgi:glycosyltransferase involved in cell wall biosynthesis